MKKAIVVKLIFLLILIGLCDIWYIKFYYLNKNNKELEREIEISKEQINNYNTNIESMNENIDKLKEEKASRIEEYNIWLRTEERIKKAL